MRRILLLAALLVVGITTSLAAQGTVMPTPRIQLFTDSGAVCAGCSLYAFTAGTSTPLNTYSEVTLTTANAHPIVLDSAGRATVYLSQASYRFRLDSAAGVTIWTQDNVTAMPGSSATITGTGDLTFQVDSDNNGTNVFTFRDGTNSERFQIAESGNVQLDGILTVGDNAHSASAAGVSGWNIAAHTTTLTGADPTTYATFYASQINLMTLAGTNANQTVTDAAGLAIAPPAESTNVILTNTHGLLVPTTAVSTATNAYGATVNAPTGATNNYAAAFLGGSVGIGTAAPAAILSVTRGTSDNGRVYLGTSSNTGQTLVNLTNTSPATTNDWQVAVGGSANALGNAFYVFENSAGTTGRRLVIASGGEVGIGTGTVVPSSKLDVTTNALGVTQTTTSGLALVNTTAAAAGAQQISPALRWSGFGWQTDAGGSSDAVDFRSYVVPVQGTANPTGYLTVESSINAAAYTERFRVASNGAISIPTAAPATPTANAAYADTLVKAWVAVTNAGVPAIDDDFNVSSLTDNGVGDTTVTLATAIGVATYAAVASPRSNTVRRHAATYTLASGSFRVFTHDDAAAAAVDVDFTAIAVGG